MITILTIGYLTCGLFVVFMVVWFIFPEIKEEILADDYDLEDMSPLLAVWLLWPVVIFMMVCHLAGKLLRAGLRWCVRNIPDIEIKVKGKGQS